MPGPLPDFSLEGKEVTLRQLVAGDALAAAAAQLRAKLEGIRRADRAGRDGVLRNSARYSIVAAEWPEAEAHTRKILR